MKLKNCNLRSHFILIVLKMNIQVWKVTKLIHTLNLFNNFKEGTHKLQ